MSIIIIDGSKRKKYKILDSFLERAYQRQQAEKEFSENLQRKRQTFIDKILNNDKIKPEEKQRIIDLCNAGKPMPLKEEVKKQIRIVSSGISGYFRSKNLIKDIKVEEIRVKIKDDKIKEIIHGVKKL